MTNLGKRRQISPASGLRPASRGSQRVVETIASASAQTPIQTSRPTTFISVNAQTA